MPEVLANAIIVIVTALMVINFGAEFFVAGYEPEPFIYTIFITVVGGTFGAQALKKRADEKNGHREKVDR